MASIVLLEEKKSLLDRSFAQPPLADRGWTFQHATWSSFSFDDLERRAADLVVASEPPGSRLLREFLETVRTRSCRVATLAVLPEDTRTELFELCIDSADDFVVCPLHAGELAGRITRLLASSEQHARRVVDRLNAESALSQLVGRNRALLQELDKVAMAARSDAEVLITGETGTGKELTARAVHHLSPRRRCPFVCVDCGALPDQLFENEVFGHERGAYTDAHRSQKGLVAMAEGGSLFLDEIDALSLPAQAKLLRFLQERGYKALGAERFVRADVRIICATNRNLEQAVEEKTFRRDLFFRINVLRLHMIPLRERRDDIEMLAQHFLGLCCAEMRQERKLFAPSSIQLLRTRDWPGNVRELYNVVRRAVVFCEGSRILPDHIEAPPCAAPPDGACPTFREARGTAVADFERRYVENMLRKHAGNITRAAREAGKDRRAFGRLVKRHNIDALHLG
jgi:two-component system response regulator GlrR